jgi:acetyl-CoA carboxylase biotin carboxyl carrier protein
MSDAETGPGDVFDVDRIRRLVELMEEHDLREVDLRQSEQRIRLSRGVVVPPLPAAPLAPLAAPAATPAPTTAPAADATTARELPDDQTVMIKSPMVGTFYTRANPNAEPFVKVGDLVDQETTVCIIEAMKVFNEIPAETRGRIVAVLADDEEPVDHGRPLFKVDISGQ